MSTPSIEQLSQRLVEMAEERFGAPPGGIDPNADFYETLGIDSYQAMELLTELEESFGVEVPDWEVQSVRTFRGLAEVVAQRL